MVIKINEVFFKCPHCKKTISMCIDETPVSRPYRHICVECSNKIQVACKVSNEVILSVEVK